jgi:3'-phosphoadenosine 5'-phosphosulfate sulfotransferase (PAPS reductase)/FAD synthetase
MRGPVHQGGAGLDEWLEKWREYFLTYYDEGGVEEKAAEAAEFARQFIGRALVSVSGGKDSMAMLHIIATRVKSSVHVFHWDHGPWLMPREVEREILGGILRVAPGAYVHVAVYSRGFSERAREEWAPWYEEFYKALEELTRQLKARYHLLGVRAEESSRRGARGRVADRVRWVEVHPLYYFTWRDVWAYIFKHNVPVPSVYYKYARLLGWEKARLVTFFDREFEKYGSPQLDSNLSWRWKHDPFTFRGQSP